MLEKERYEYLKENDECIKHILSSYCGIFQLDWIFFECTDLIVNLFKKIKNKKKWK